MSRIAYIFGIFVLVLSLLYFQDNSIDLQDSQLSEELRRWKEKGKMTNFMGFKVFTIVIENDVDTSGNDTLLILHGFPTSSFDFRNTIEILSTRFKKIVLFDYLGYGFSEKPLNYSYSLIEQADLALAIWKENGISSGHLLAHDMGDSVATELLARRDRDLLPCWFKGFHSVTFNNGGMHIELSDLRISQVLLKNPYLGEYVAKMMNFFTFKKQIESIISPGSFSDKEFEMMWESINYNRGRRVMHLVIKYLDERYRFQPTGRWTDCLKNLNIPCHIIWGELDAVAPISIANKLSQEIPNSKLTLLHHVGHFPMIEDAPNWAKIVLSFY